MAVLTGGQVAAYAREAGFKPGEVQVMVAIAWVESSFNTNAKNPTSTATGLWQILASHEQFKGWDLTDPAVNAKAARKLYVDAKGFKPWTASQGKWTRKENIALGLKYAQQGANVSVPDLPGHIGVPDVITDPLNAVKDTAESTADAVKAVGGAVGWLSQPANLRRVAYVWVGGSMVLAGVVLIGFPYAKPIASKALKVATPIGRISSLAEAGAAA
jgi:hypothetical protein